MEKLLLLEQLPAGVKAPVEAEITEICTDTRLLTKGCLFIYLKRERFDAHEFILKKAFELGAAACVSEKNVENCKCIITKDCRKALLDIAHYYKSKFSPLLVGVMGSVGKTTTKEFISLVLSEKFETLKTQEI